MRSRSRPTVALFAAVLVAGGAGMGCPAPPSVRGPEHARTSETGVVSSNVRFSDYAGSRACEACHPSETDRWKGSAMHAMTRDPTTATIHAPFDGATFRFKEDTAVFEKKGGARFVTIASKRFGTAVYRVTRVIGGRHREDFAGVRVASVDGNAAISNAEDELVLPVSYVLGTQSFRYKGYSVMVKERAGLRAGPVWNQTCIFCHNTVPYMSTVLGALLGPKAPPYQGEVLDPLLPEDKRALYKVTNASALAHALEDEEKRIGAEVDGTLAGSITGTRRHFRREHLVELGIGCESCHLGSAEHVRNPKVMPSLEPKSDAFEVRVPLVKDGTTHAADVNRACARCHQVLFSGYEHTWEGGARKRNPGGSNINSGEARDMLLGACASKLSCVDCHDPHRPDAALRQREMSVAQEDVLCTRCHQKLTAPAALRAHAHHDPAGAGARCLGCHMPRKNMSLDGKLSRYHRIGSPTDSARVLLDRPLECALCHADKSVESLVSTMESWYSRTYDRPALVKLYGDLSSNVLRETAVRGKPHEQAVAYFVLGEAKDRAAIAALTPGLRHPYPIVRGYAKRALDMIAGAPVPIDIDAENDVIERATDAWLRSAAH